MAILALAGSWYRPVAVDSGPMAGLLEDDGVLSPFMAVIAVAGFV